MRLTAWPVVLAALASVFGAAVLLAVSPPAYLATSKLQVTPLSLRSKALSDLPLLHARSDATDGTLATAVTLTSNPGVYAAAARTAEGNWTLASVQRAVTVAPIPGTNLIGIQAKAPRAQYAARLATAVAQQAIALRTAALKPRLRVARLETVQRLRALRLRVGRDAQQGAAQDLVDRLSAIAAVSRAGDPTYTFAAAAEIPETPEGLPGWARLLLAALAGSIVGVLAQLLLRALPSRRIQDTADIRAILGPVPTMHLTHVNPEAITRGEEPAVTDAVLSLLLQLELSGPPVRSILVTAAEENVGRTTTVCAFAGALAEAESRVLVADLDRAGDTGVPVAVDSRRIRVFSPPPDRPLNVQALPWARRKRRRLVIDAPAIGHPQTAGLLPQVDAVILVVRPGHSSREALERAGTALESAGVRSVAVVENAGARFPASVRPVPRSAGGLVSVTSQV